MASTILIILGVLLLFLLAVLLVRTAGFMKSENSPEPAASLPVDADVVAEHLSKAVRAATPSTPPNDPPALADMQALHSVLMWNYPNVHALPREVINGGALLFTWAGTNPELPAVLFMAHMDVVPADERTLDQWTYPPFSGEIAEGFVWGRGTLDDKSSMIGILEAAEMLLKQEWQPERTILLAFGHDEETSGNYGAISIAERSKERGVRLAAVLDEGGAIMQGTLPGVDFPVALIGIAEKGYLTLKVWVDGKGGHSAMPPAETPIGILGRALAKLDAHQFPARLDPLVSLYRGLGSRASFLRQMIMSNTWLFGGLIRNMVSASPSSNASIRTTMVPTMVSGGVKENILPSHAEALVNLRLLPGDTIAAVCDRVRRVINDERVQFETVSAWEASQISNTEGEWYQSIAHAARRCFPEAAVAPYYLMGATDSRHYRELTDEIFRFTPLPMSSEDLARVHGINERVSVEALAPMVQFFGQLMQEWAK